MLDFLKIKCGLNSFTLFCDNFRRVLEKRMLRGRDETFLWRKLLSWFQTYRFGGGLWGKHHVYSCTLIPGRAMPYEIGSSNVRQSITWVSCSVTQGLQSQNRKRHWPQKVSGMHAPLALIHHSLSGKQSVSSNSWTVFKNCVILYSKRLRWTKMR